MVLGFTTEKQTVSEIITL